MSQFDEPPPLSTRIQPGHWFSIGLLEGPTPLRLAPRPGNPILSYRDVPDVPTIFVSDPFLLPRDDAWYLFFEVMNEPAYKGEIALATSSDLDHWQYRGRVLEEACSLSYPFVFAWADEVYMVPDRYRCDEVVLYRAHAFPHDWRPVATLLDHTAFDHGVADATVFRHADRWWLFACTDPETANSVLRLYHAERLTGPWREHRQSPIVDGDATRARPAGRVIARDGGLLRFAQVCVPRYGTSVRVFHIDELSETRYAEHEVTASSLAPSGAGWNAQAMHHVDLWPLGDGFRSGGDTGWIACVDGHDHPSYRDERA